MNSEYKLKDVAAELRREIAMRKLVYPRLILQGKITPDLAEKRVALMSAAAGIIEAQAVQTRQEAGQ